MKTGFFFIIKNKTSVGKDISQLLHAGQKLYEKEGGTTKKIVYKLPIEEIPVLLYFFKNNNIRYYEIRDAGKTQVKPNTLTVICTSLDDDTSFFSRYKLY